jgi:hypothetical protein
MHDTDSSRVELAPGGAGAGTTVHAVPFHDSISGRWVPELLML